MYEFKVGDGVRVCNKLATSGVIVGLCRPHADVPRVRLLDGSGRVMLIHRSFLRFDVEATLRAASTVRKGEFHDAGQPNDDDCGSGRQATGA